MEKGGERWSKPHVATLSLHSLMELRMCIEKGTIMLDMEASTLSQVVGKFTAVVKDTCLESFNCAHWKSRQGVNVDWSRGENSLKDAWKNVKVARHHIETGTVCL